MRNDNARINVIGNEKEFGYVIGVLLGDGCISEYKGTRQVAFSSIDREFTVFFNENLKAIFNKKIPIYIYIVKNSKYNNKPKYCLHLYSKKVYLFLKPKIDNLNWIYKQNDIFKMMVLKGLFDSEGFVSKEKSFCVSFSNTDEEIIKLFIKLCKEFDIETKRFKEYQYSNNCSSKQVKILPLHIEKFYTTISGLTIKRKERKILKIINRINNKKNMYEIATNLRSNGYGNVKIFKFLKSRGYDLTISMVEGWLYSNKIPCIYKYKNQVQ